MIYLAQTAPSDALSNSQGQLGSIYAYWQTIWQQTFSGYTSGSAYYEINYFATFIAVMGVSFWLFQWGKEMSSGGAFQEGFPKLIVVFAVLIFLGNHGQNLAALNQGIRALIHSWQEQILLMEITGTSLKDSLNDELATQQAKDILETLIHQCDSLPAPDVAIPSLTPPSDTSTLTTDQKEVYAKFACYQQLTQQAQQIQQQFTQNFCSNLSACTSLNELFSNFQAGLSAGIAAATSTNGTSILGTLLGGVPAAAEPDIAPIARLGDAIDAALGSFIESAATNVVKQILYGIQWIFGNLVEMALWLNAMAGPIAVATSLFGQGGSRPVFPWLIAFFSIGLTQIYYVVLLGVTASLLVGTQMSAISDLIFPLMLAIFAPLIALALATGGALVAMRSLSSEGSRLLGEGISTASHTLDRAIGTIISVLPFL